MNKCGFVVVSVMYALFIGNVLFASDKTAQSVFVPRDFVTDSVFEQGFNNFRSKNLQEEFVVNHSKNTSMFLIQAAYISTGDSAGLGKYFLLNNKNTIRFKEKPGSDSDVASEHFGLTGAQVTQKGSDKANPSSGPFDSSLTLRPKRSLHGVVLGFHGTLDNVLEGMFVEARFPVVHVRHTLKMDEHNENALSTNSPSTILQALNQSDWLYGKFNTQKMVREGVDDLLLRIGYNYADTRRLYGTLYGDIIAPLGEGPTGQFIFEPTVGSVHAGLGIGSTIDWQFHKGDTHKISVIGDARYHYRFGGKEVRSMDLKANGPWSRYLRLSRRGGVRPLDGINYLTRAVDVLPKGSFQLLASLHYQYLNMHFEGGYNLYARSRENVELHDKWDSEKENFGIYQPVSYLNRTASLMTINTAPEAAAQDDSFVLIKEEDIDLRSAAHESALSHKVYGGASVKYFVFNFPARIGVGTSYEFGESNTALSQWSMWFNTSVQF